MRTIAGLPLVLGAFLTSGAFAPADTKAGAVQLPELKLGEESAKRFQVTVGEQVKARCAWYVNPDFFKRRVVAVGAEITNTAKQPMYYGYYVAFFDKDKNLLGCSSFTGKFTRLEAGKSMQIGNILDMPSAAIGKIAYYQVTLLEDAKEFGE